MRAELESGVPHANICLKGPSADTCLLYTSDAADEMSEV